MANIKRVVKSLAILQAENGQSQMLTAVENLNLFFEKETTIEFCRMYDRFLCLTFVANSLQRIFNFLYSDY